MILPKWSTFIIRHPQNNALETAKSQLIDAFAQSTSAIERTANLAAIQSSPSSIILTLNPFDNTITKSFYHQSPGLIFGDTTPAKCIALLGFENPAVPIYFNLEKLQSQSTEPCPLPTLSNLMSMHSAPLANLKTLQPSEDNSHIIRHAAILPPYLSHMVVTSTTTDPWLVLHHIIQAIAVLRPEDSEENDWTIAQPYAHTLNTLWSFCNPTTTPNLATMYTVATDTTAQTWSSKVHKEQLPNTNNTTKQIDSTAAIDRLTDTIQRNTGRFGAAPEEQSDDDDNDDKALRKAWKKIDRTLQTGILLASSPDGFTVPTVPSPRQLIKAKSGTTAQRLFKNWHTDLEIIVQPGMATNITKCLLTSSPDEFSIDTFSPFFTTPIRAGFTHMSNTELNSMEFACKSFNLTTEDIKRMTDTKPYVPTCFNVFKQQLRNFSAVVDDVFTPDSILAQDVQAATQHCIKNELHYINMFEQHRYFGVWFLDRLHFKVQSILHRCFQASDIEDIEFQMFSFKEELRNISTLNFLALAPKWYLEEEEKQFRLAQKRNGHNQQHNHQQQRHSQQYPPFYQGHGGGGFHNSPYKGRDHRPFNDSPNGQAKRIRVDNPDQDSVVALTQGERYPRIVHRTNLSECKDSAPKINGEFICNNWQIRGFCHNTCPRASTHVTLNPELRGKYRAYVTKLRKLAQEYEKNRPTFSPTPPQAKGGPPSDTRIHKDEGK
jgi:hypothetical protein